MLMIVGYFFESSVRSSFLQVRFLDILSCFVCPVSIMMLRSFEFVCCIFCGGQCPPCPGSSNDVFPPFCSCWQTQRLRYEQHKTNVVLYNILPKGIAKNLVRVGEAVHNLNSRLWNDRDAINRLILLDKSDAK